MEAEGLTSKQKYNRQYYQDHKEELQAKDRKRKSLYYREHKEEIREKNRLQIQKVKREVLTYYSDGNCVCVHCYIGDIRVLSIDHIEGGGREHRRVASGNSMYYWLKRNNFPPGYQTLCMNCQFIKRAEQREYGSRKP